MKKLCLLLFFSTLLLSFQTAIARDWRKGEQNRLIANVKDIKNNVSGNMKTVADDFKQQLEDLVAKGMILRVSVQEFLTWLQMREQPYLDFVGELGGNKCNTNTPCGKLREDLKTFFLDMGALKDNFPAIEKSGFGDGSRAANVVDISPPIILFALDELLNRRPDWKEFPAKLQSIFDEIDDPDVFSVRLEEDEEIASASSSLAAPALFDKTPTQRFCDRWEGRLDNELDPIRANRIKYFVNFIRGYIKVIETGFSETIGGCIVGEGSDTVIPNPVKLFVAMIEFALDSIQNAVQTFRDNLGVCRANRRELEMQVAECIELVDFKLPSKRDEVYNLVKTKVENAGAEGLPVGASEDILLQVDIARADGDFRKAYHKLCDAYAKIGKE